MILAKTLLILAIIVQSVRSQRCKGDRWIADSFVWNCNSNNPEVVACVSPKNQEILIGEELVLSDRILKCVKILTSVLLIREKNPFAVESPKKPEIKEEKRPEIAESIDPYAPNPIDQSQLIDRSNPADATTSSNEGYKYTFTVHFNRTRPNVQLKPSSALKPGNAPLFHITSTNLKFHPINYNTQVGTSSKFNYAESRKDTAEMLYDFEILNFLNSTDTDIGKNITEF